MVLLALLVKPARLIPRPVLRYPNHAGGAAMNWHAIGAVGQMIGALAVVVTLAYLALQVRASTKELAANHLATN